MVWVLLLAATEMGCATLRLNGCLKRAECNDNLTAYVCADDHICADQEGHTLRSEPVSSSRNPCHICAGASP